MRAQAQDFAEFTAQCVERAEDNPENWPTLDELPETSVSDLMRVCNAMNEADHDSDSSDGV